MARVLQDGVLAGIGGKDRVEMAINSFTDAVDSTVGSSQSMHVPLRKKYEQYMAKQQEESLKGISVKAVRPWNFADFQSRIYTFNRTSHWFAKPAEMSAVQCARHGWRNTDVDTITCLSCSASVVCAGIVRTSI
jgi:hypothetical protein